MTNEREYYRKQLEEEGCKLDAAGIVTSGSEKKKKKNSHLTLGY
jgi:hypothetical protein